MTLDEQLKAVEREIGMRLNVYHGRVIAKNMSETKADHEVEAMRAVKATLLDYMAMQPKVLALTATALALAKSIGMPQVEFDKMLVEAETEARLQLGAAKVAKAVEGALAKAPPYIDIAGTAWPFPGGRRP